MPFFLYKVEADWASKIRTISLAGLHGPICAAAKRHPDEAEWELDEASLLEFLQVDPENHAVIIDLKPSQPTEISLYRLRHIWAYYSPGWTPLAVELEALYVDDYAPDGTRPSVFKERFPITVGSGSRVYEFLYLNEWNWGPVGSVNAAVLESSIFDSFLKRINLKRRHRDHLPLLGTIDA